MFKRNILWSLVLLLAMGLIFGFCVSFSFAEESVTITTYYPSPSGVYNELQTNKFAVGDTDDSGGLSPGDLPPVDGQLYTARSVIYKPQGDLEALANPKPGELAYKSSEKKLYFYNGEDWLPVAGSGGCYVSHKAIELMGAGSNCSGDDCCISGFTNQGPAGWWSPAAKSAERYYVFHPFGGACGGWCSSEVGEAFLCCR